MKRIILIGLMGAVISSPLYADGTNTPAVDSRQANQEKRIEQGEKSGALTKKEAARMQARETKLQADEAAAKADGTVTTQERRALRKEERQDSRAIERTKHNAATVQPAPK